MLVICRSRVPSDKRGISSAQYSRPTFVPLSTPLLPEIERAPQAPPDTSLSHDWSVLMDNKTYNSEPKTLPQTMNGKLIPPWELVTLPQVPYIPSRPERPELSASRGSRSGSTPPMRSSSKPASLHHETNSWSSEERGGTDLASARLVPTHTRSAPMVPAYEQSHLIPARSNSRDLRVNFPHQASFVFDSPSARSNSTTRGRPRKAPTKKQGKSGKDKRGESEPWGRRFKTVVKEIFKKDPVDEDDYEEIADRHWTE